MAASTSCNASWSVLRFSSASMPTGGRNFGAVPGVRSPSLRLRSRFNTVKTPAASRPMPDTMIAGSSKPPLSEAVSSSTLAAAATGGAAGASTGVGCAAT